MGGHYGCKHGVKSEGGSTSCFSRLALFGILVDFAFNLVCAPAFSNRQIRTTRYPPKRVSFIVCVLLCTFATVDEATTKASAGGRTPHHFTPTRGMASGKRHTAHLTLHTLHATWYTSHVTPYTSHGTHHTSHPTLHTAHVTRHTAHVTGSRFALVMTFPVQSRPLVLCH
jgi:hypothetical protein